MALSTRSTHQCSGGTVHFLEHASASTGTTMRLSLFMPPAGDDGSIPAVIFLSGLTCTEENFTTKAGAYRRAARLGLAVIAPDTSPRGDGVADDAAYDLGQGASFYVDATVAPWTAHFQMATYVVDELPALVGAHYPVDLTRVGLMGHSMGGHGALVLGLRHPDRFQSLSALAPICNPSATPWGQKAFGAYLGPDPAAWAANDATCLLSGLKRNTAAPILIDQGLADPYLATELKPEALEQAAAQAGQRLVVRRHRGYDHGYFFISTFIDDHLEHHAALLRSQDS